MLAGAWWPWPERRATGEARLDAFVPAYQFVEVHETRVRATPDVGLPRHSRGQGRRDPGLPDAHVDPLSAPALAPWARVDHRPRRRTSRSWTCRRARASCGLSDEPGHEAVVGTVVCCRRTRLSGADRFPGLTQPGIAKAGMNFRIEDLGAGECRVTTETRVFATDVATRRRFGLYWAFIYPGSSLIRDGWLAAIKKRAEADGSSEGRPGHDRVSRTSPISARSCTLVEDDLARVEDFFEEQVRSDIPLVAEVGRYIREGGGKRIRPALVLLVVPDQRLPRGAGDLARGHRRVHPLGHAAPRRHRRRSRGAPRPPQRQPALGQRPGRAPRGLRVHEVDRDGAVPGQPAHPAPAVGRDAAHDRGPAAGDPSLRRPARDGRRSHRHHPAQDGGPVLGLPAHRGDPGRGRGRHGSALSPATARTSGSASRWSTICSISRRTRNGWASRSRATCARAS